LAWNLQALTANIDTALEITMLINLNDYRKAKAANVAVRGRDEELLCVNWNPAFGLIALSCFQRPRELSPALPEEADAVKPAFINRVYALASQI
jgi:hypothetical protein